MKLKLNALFTYSVACGLFAAGNLGPTEVSAAPLDEMISPVSHPVTFEDPRHSTELRPIFAYHEIDDSFVTGGGNAQVYALQARLKLTDDLSLIATKDGLVVLNPNGVVPDDEGFADVAAGLKYSVYRTESEIVTVGLRYEIPIGKEEIFQGREMALSIPLSVPERPVEILTLWREPACESRSTIRTARCGTSTCMPTTNSAAFIRLSS